MISNDYVPHTDFCETKTDMDSTIRFGVCNGAEEIGRMSYIPRIIMRSGCRIQLK